MADTFKVLTLKGFCTDFKLKSSSVTSKSKTPLTWNLELVTEFFKKHKIDCGVFCWIRVWSLDLLPSANGRLLSGPKLRILDESFLSLRLSLAEGAAASPGAHSVGCWVLPNYPLFLLQTYSWVTLIFCFVLKFKISMADLGRLNGAISQFSSLGLCFGARGMTLFFIDSGISKAKSGSNSSISTELCNVWMFWIIMGVGLINGINTENFTYEKLTKGGSSEGGGPIWYIMLVQISRFF